MYVANLNTVVTATAVGRSRRTVKATCLAPLELKHRIAYNHFLVQSDIHSVWRRLGGFYTHTEKVSQPTPHKVPLGMIPGSEKLVTTNDTNDSTHR